MTCRTIDLGNGATAIVCTRGERQHRCKECGARATKQCDFILRGSKVGKLCSVYLCARCAVDAPVHYGPDRDLCPAHARVAAKGTQQQLPLTEET